LKPIEDENSPNRILKKCNAILEPLTKAVPGLIQGIYYLAKVKYILGDTDGAKINLSKILDKDSSNQDAQTLMTQVREKEALIFISVNFRHKKSISFVKSISLDQSGNKRFQRCKSITRHV
jgi:hypothetical protein